MHSGWPWRVGLRYLRARTHNRFVSFISGISILGVALGVAVLIVVLSVMNGFETELRTRILAMTSHASLEPFGEGLADWRAVRDRVEAAVDRFESETDWELGIGESEPPSTMNVARDLPKRGPSQLLGRLAFQSLRDRLPL